jgi:hypothetical protein
MKAVEFQPLASDNGPQNTGSYINQYTLITYYVLLQQNELADRCVYVCVCAPPKVLLFLNQHVGLRIIHDTIWRRNVSQI